MRLMWIWSLLLLGCPSAPKVFMEGGLTESFVEDGVDDGSDDTGETVDEAEDGGGGEDDGEDDDGTTDLGGLDGDGGDDGADDEEDDEEDEDSVSFAGEYDGVMGQSSSIGTCEDEVTVYIDEDNSFVVEGICDAGLTNYTMVFEGSFDEDGEASGTFTTELPFGDSESTELEGSISDDEIDLYAEFSRPVLGGIVAYFKTE